jgi:hypothetical protein
MWNIPSLAQPRTVSFNLDGTSEVSNKTLPALLIYVFTPLSIMLMTNTSFVFLVGSRYVYYMIALLKALRSSVVQHHKNAEEPRTKN